VRNGWLQVGPCSRPRHPILTGSFFTQAEKSTEKLSPPSARRRKDTARRSCIVLRATFPGHSSKCCFVCLQSVLFSETTSSQPQVLTEQRASNWRALSVFREVVGLMMRGGLLHQVPAGWGV